MSIDNHMRDGWRKGGTPITLEEYRRATTPPPKPPDRGTRSHEPSPVPFNWRDWARCTAENKPLEFFFPPQLAPANVTAEIRNYCARCPVRSECLQLALDEGLRDGWFGGMSPKQRRQIRSGRVRLHGTEVMWQYGPEGTDVLNGCRCPVCVDFHRVNSLAKNERRKHYPSRPKKRAVS